MLRTGSRHPLVQTYLWLIARLAFTAGWSLVWASGLLLITFLPLPAGLF